MRFHLHASPKMNRGVTEERRHDGKRKVDDHFDRQHDHDTRTKQRPHRRVRPKHEARFGDTVSPSLRASLNAPPNTQHSPKKTVEHRKRTTVKASVLRRGRCILGDRLQVFCFVFLLKWSCVKTSVNFHVRSRNSHDSFFPLRQPVSVWLLRPTCQTGVPGSGAARSADVTDHSEIRRNSQKSESVRNYN